jgi:predicted kinase
MSKLVMMKGLPGSGKSTIAKAMVEELGYVRTNKDELRTLHPNWGERKIVELRDGLITQALKDGKNIVVDDTNFNPVHEKALRAFAKQYDYQFEEVFVDTPIEECMKRDNARANGVGETVIRKMYNQYLKPKPSVIEHDPKLKNIILCDLDGTLAHMTNRGPYDPSGYIDDAYDEVIHNIITLAEDDGDEVIFLSGRSEDYKEETVEWLKKRHWQNNQLYMRPLGDQRNDAIVKQELYEKHIKGQYNVMYVLDDRNRVVDMWRSIGLKVLQVAEGDF